MILHIFAIIELTILFLMLKYYGKLIKVLEKAYDYIIGKIEHKEALKHLGEHRGMYNYFKEEE